MPPRATIPLHGDRDFLRQRARAGTFAVLFAVLGLAGADVVFRFGHAPSIQLVHALDLVAIAAVLAFLRQPRPRRHIIGALFALMLAQAVTSCSIAVIGGSSTTSTVAFVALSMGAAALLPIRWTEHLALITPLAIAYAVEIVLLASWATPWQSREATALYVLFAASVLVAGQLERTRRRLVTERRARHERESELEAHRSFLRQVIDSIPHGILVKDRSGRITLANRTLADAYGLRPRDLIGKRDEEIHPFRDEVEHFRRKEAKVLATKQAQHGRDETVTTVDGARHVFETTHRPIFDAHGEIRQILCVAIDVTEHRRVLDRIADESRVANALAHAGREIIAALNRPDLLERLCRVGADGLGADFAQLWLHDEDSDGFRPASQVDFPAELWEAVQWLTVPRQHVATLAERAAHGEAVFMRRAEVQDEIPEPFLAAVPELDSFAVVPLLRGTALAGILGLGFERPAFAFGPAEQRIADGLSHLASVALESARLYRELEGANRLKSEFVATMSHELRTPLNVIVGYVDLLADLELGELNTTQADSLARVRANALQLLEMIEATLDLSRLESGRMPVEISTVDAGDFLAAVRNEARDLSRGEAVTVDWRMNGDRRPLCTDVPKLKVVLQNLVRNAVKFTEIGRVEVDLRSGAEAIELVVHDSGPGVPVEAREAIFEPFRQASSEVNVRYGGVGLGLYIVRRLVETLGGTVSLESEVGAGSTFRVVLPQADLGEAAEGAVAERNAAAAAPAVHNHARPPESAHKASDRPL